MFAFYAECLQKTHEVFILESNRPFIDRLLQDGLAVKNISYVELKNNPDNFIAIFVGGGYFGEPEIGKKKWHRSFSTGYFPKTIKLLNEVNVPFIIQGVEAGPISDAQTREKIKKYFDAAMHATVRNKSSLAFCEVIGANGVKYLPDVVLAGAKNYYETKFQEDQKNVGHFEVSIHITGRLFSKNPLARLNLNSIAKELVSIGPKSVALFFDQTTYENSFQPQIEKLSSQLSKSGIDVRTFKYEGHEALLRLLKTSKLVVTTKLHAGMSALSFENKVLSISSAPKIKRFYNENSITHFHCDYFFSTPRKKAKTLRAILEKQSPWIIPNNIREQSMDNVNNIELLLSSPNL
jgi:polysaccharide pyruvyl transferase WcaK-like protein